MEQTPILSQNIKVLLWLGNRNNGSLPYSEYVRKISDECMLEYSAFMDIIQGTRYPTAKELSLIVKTFRKLGYDLETIETKLLFPDITETAGNELMDLNIQHLIHTIPYGQHQHFLESIGMNPSTLSRWKRQKTRPDTYAKEQIASYFGFESSDELMLSFLFLGVEPITDTHKKLYCQNRIDQMDNEAFGKIYPVLVKLLK